MSTLEQLPSRVELIDEKLDVITAMLAQLSPNKTKKRLSVDEACEITGYSKHTLYSKVQKNEIPFKRLGGRKLYFDSEELESWIENGK